jgi:hypothetical protein
VNIFVLDLNPLVAARYHTDRHVVKMILESAQMLSTAHRILDPDCDGWHDRVGLYQSAYTNHPCTVWARQGSGNYTWLYRLFRSLCDEYTHRYGKVHASSKLLAPLWQIPLALRGGPNPFRTEFAQAMPDHFKHPDAVQAYQAYYRHAKSHLHKWTGRPVPSWIAN